MNISFCVVSFGSRNTVYSPNTDVCWGVSPTCPFVIVKQTEQQSIEVCQTTKERRVKGAECR